MENTLKVKLYDYVKIENCGIGKVTHLYKADEYNETGTIIITIAEVKYYRDINKNNEVIDNLKDVTASNEKEYIQFLKEMIKQLNAKSKSTRKAASDFNKLVDGEATKRKGKVSVVNNNIVGLVENSVSRHHRELLNDAKKMKETKEKLKKELAYFKNKTA